MHAIAMVHKMQRLALSSSSMSAAAASSASVVVVEPAVIQQEAPPIEQPSTNPQSADQPTVMDVSPEPI